jgi:hypothetical protein
MACGRYFRVTGAAVPIRPSSDFRDGEGGRIPPRFGLRESDDCGGRWPIGRRFDLIGVAPVCAGDLAWPLRISGGGIPSPSSPFSWAARGIETIMCAACVSRPGRRRRRRTR